VVDGRIVEGAAHRERFGTSTGLDAGPAWEAAVAALRGAGVWRLRVDDVDGRPVTTASAAVRPAVLEGGWDEVEIALVEVSGGLGPHKWVDRGLVQDLDLRHAPFVPVLCDGGEVLEATWANVLAVVGGRLCTPPLDGRILPGVTRRALLDVAVDLGVPVAIAPLGADQLATADAVLLTSAVRGLLWVRAIEGRRRFDAPHLLVATLAGALGRRWSS